MKTPIETRIEPQFASGNEKSPTELDARWSSLLMVTFIAFAATLRFPHLASKSLWFDEALTARLIQLPTHAFTHALWRGGEANMTLYYVIMRAWTHLGSSEWVLRSFSVLAGIAAVPIFYLLAKRLFGPRVGFISALLLTVNACHMAYSQEARSYALFFFLALLSSYFFVRALESDATSHYVVYAITSALAVYAHFFGFLLVGSQWISLLAPPRGKICWRKLILAAILFALLVSPALYFILGRPSGQLAWVPKATVRDLQRFGYFLVADNGRWRHPLLAVYLILAGVAAVLAFKRRREQPGSLATWKGAFLLCWFIIPPAVALIVSIWKPVFVPRFLIFCLAPLLVLAASALGEIRTAWQRNVLTLALVGASLVPTIWYYRQPKEQWREAVDSIARQAQAGDSVILVGNYARVPFDYYQARTKWPGGVSLVRIPDAPSPINPEPHGARLWVLMHDQRKDPTFLQFLGDLARHYNETSEQRYFMVTVRLYSRPISQQNP